MRHGIDPRCLFLIAAAAIMGAACTTMSQPATANQVIGEKDFEASIFRLEEHDPQSPEALNARFEYADFLSEPTAGDCQQQLDAAQAQLDTLTGRPATHFILPLGPAKLANGEYKIHIARAACFGDQLARHGELQKALEAAQQAVELYRNALDYQSATIMQFNLAVTDHELGAESAAISALDSAIAMDREFGFRDDAEDNYKLLLHWRNEENSDSKVADLMKNFPARSAQFNFNWSSNDADVAIDANETNLVNAKVIHSRGATVLKRHVRADSENWAESNEFGNSTYNLGEWPVEAKQLQGVTMYFLSSALLQTPNIEIGSNGDFASVAYPNAFARKLTAEVSARIGQISSVSDEPPGSAHAMMGDTSVAFSPEFIEFKAMQDYDIETATWIGAKLEQGAWYQMSTPLFLPGLGEGKVLVMHDVEFSYTRQVACTAGASDRSCAEIVVHATPDADDLKATLKEVARKLEYLKIPSLHYWSTSDLRLVIKPDTLLPYIRDTRRYWYLGFGGAGKSDPVIESERIVSTSTYH